MEHFDLLILHFKASRRVRPLLNPLLVDVHGDGLSREVDQDWSLRLDGRFHESVIVVN
jgi:hypothetical protein